MAKGRQTKIVARVQVTGTVTELHGKRFLTWSCTTPISLQPTEDGKIPTAVKTDYFSESEQAVDFMHQWLADPNNVKIDIR